MDLLIIEKRKNVQIQNEIGRIFRRHNVIEYKSPDDGMTIDDFFKTLGYAYLYKGLGEKVDQIPLEELTISLFRAIVPKQLFNKLAGYGYAIEMQVSGIYYVQGLAIPAQIIVTSELELQNHESLKVLSKSAEKEDIQKFTEMAKNFKEPGDKEKADAVLQVSVVANKEKYDEVRRSTGMCEALRELMKDEIEEELKKNRDQAIKEGRAEGENLAKKEMAYELYHAEGKNKFGKARVVVIKSQLGNPIMAFSGDSVYWEIPEDLPKMTKLMIDGKALYIHRANFQIIDKELIQ